MDFGFVYSSPTYHALGTVGPSDDNRRKGVLSTPTSTNVPTDGITAMTMRKIMMMMIITINENNPENIPSAYTVSESAE